MSWEILIHPEVEMWISTLSDKEYMQVSAAIEALRFKGPLLGRPLADQIKGTRVQKLKELRPLGTNIRILFYFDKSRRATLLVAGDKSSDWKDWYRINVTLAEYRIKLKESENG
jgi:hypothetical protein